MEQPELDSDVKPTCEEKWTECGSSKEIACGKESADWCRLRDIWICQSCCESCYAELYPDGCMEAKNMFHLNLKSPTSL